MPQAARMIQIKVADRTIRARLMEEENPEVVKLVCAQLPLRSFALHTNVSGQGLVLPTPITYVGAGHMVDRHPGSIYLFAPGQSIVITYGDTKESAPVNRFAVVLKEDMRDLRAAGKSVFDSTLAAAQHSIAPATVSICDDADGVRVTPSLALPEAAPKFTGGWKSVEALFRHEAKRVLQEEPDEVFASFAGFVPTGMGTGGNVLPVWMHTWCCLMTDGPSTLYHFLRDSDLPSMTLPMMKDLTRYHLLQPFNHFEFLADLGLPKFKAWGKMYSSALADLESLDEYKQLTAALLTLVNVYLRRVQSRFPFHLGRAFPRVSKDEILKLSGLCY